MDSDIPNYISVTESQPGIRLPISYLQAMAEPVEPPQPMLEEDANSPFSQDEASTGDEAPHNGSSVGAPRKRKREKYEKTSCELCKARKVKCDRAEPACSWCARHNRQCVYLERQKPGSRIGFGLELEAKVNRIDALLQALGRRVEEHIDTHDRPPLIQTPSPAITSHVDSFRQAGSTAVPSVGTPPSQARSYPSAYWSGSDAPDVSQYGVQPSVAGSNLSIHGTYEAPTSSPAVLGLHQQPANAATALADLPPQDIIYTLVDLYFKHCNTWCPILDRKTAFGTFFGSTSMNEANRVLLHAIVATTLRFLKDPRLSYESKVHYHAVSKRTVQLYGMENVSIEALRALVILSLDELGTSNGPKGWNLLSILVQNARQLDLCEENIVFLSAQEDNVPQTESIRKVIAGRPQTWIEDEGRRRLCWMIYLLDRYATVAATTFDFLLDEQKMQRILPCSYDLFSRNVAVETQSYTPSTGPDGIDNGMWTVNKPENLGSFAYHCEILRILSKIHEFLRAPVDLTTSSDVAEWRNTYQTLDASLDAWLQGLPSEYSRISALCHSDPASRVANWFMLHSAYVIAVVRLHSPAAYPTIRSRYFAPSHYAMQRCLSAVQSLGDIARDVFEANGLDLLGPPFAFSLWVAARLLLVHAATVQCPVDPAIEYLIETLQHVGQYWEVANKYATVLSRVLQHSQTSDTSLSVMRKSAYDLVTITTTTRRSGLDQTTTQPIPLSELDNIDVFDFFNYPNIAAPKTQNASGTRSLLVTTTADGLGGAGLPDPETDWLRFGSPYH